MTTKKDRRHSGRVVTKIYNPVEEPYEYTFWDDWNDYRDGQRDKNNSKDTLRKIKKLNKIRKVRKMKKSLHLYTIVYV